MQRVDTPTAAAELPAQNAAGTPGYFTQGDPSGALPATVPGQDWYNVVQEELMAIVLAAGLTPDKTTTNQVLQAIKILSNYAFPSITASVGSNALTLGMSPCELHFRNSTLTNGVPNLRTISDALSLVVPSGATLGTVNGQEARLVLLAIDNTGTVELAVVNLAGGNNLDETTLISTTAIGTGSDSNNVIYSTSARSNVPFRVVGIAGITEATAGTWATAPTLVQGIGGQAMAALSSIGYGQTWQNVAGSRSIGTTYYNTTGKPIVVSITFLWSSGGNPNLTIDGVSIGEYNATATRGHITAIVPQGKSYLLTGTGSVIVWTELR